MVTVHPIVEHDGQKRSHTGTIPMTRSLDIFS